MVASWGAGKLKETQSQFFSPTIQADAGPGKVTGWGSYSGAAEFAGWCVTCFPKMPTTPTGPSLIHLSDLSYIFLRIQYT